MAQLLGPDEWLTVALASSMKTRSLLIGLCVSARTGVVRAMATADSEGHEVRLLPDQTWARVSAVLFCRSIFVTGGAGVGKTTTSSTIIQDLKHWHETPHGRVVYARAARAHSEASRAAAEVAEARREAQQRRLPPPSTPMPDVPPAPEPPRKLKILVTASTGAAARLIGGLTVHSAFNVRSQPRRADGVRVVEQEDVQGAELDDPLGDHLAAETGDGLHDTAEHDDAAFANDGDGGPRDAPGEWSVVVLNPSLRSLLGSLDVLLVDEVSMVDGDLLNLVDRACRKARGVARPFGGVVVLPVGDFCQLAPVITPGRRDDGGDHGYAFESDAWRALNPRVVDLVTPVRQDAGDPARGRFIEVLGRWRRGRATATDIDWLDANGHRPLAGHFPGGTQLGLLLTTRTAVRDGRNATMLARVAGEPQARDADANPGQCDLMRARVGGIEARSGEPYALHDPRAWRTVPRPDFRVHHHKKAKGRFAFKIGARVRCCRNTYGPDDDGVRRLLVPNGAVGTILDSTFEEGTAEVVASVHVRWDRAARTIPAFERTQEPAWFDRMQHRSYPHPEHGPLPFKVVRRQLALEICFAKTIHSAQGTSVFEPTDLCIDKNRAPPPPGDGPKTFAPIHGLVYTAVSRFASERLIRHVPTNGGHMCRPDDVHCDALVTAFYEGAAANGAPQWLREAVGTGQGLVAAA